MNELLGGRYRLLEPLGRGGMGTVYAAVQEGLGRRVAVKILDARLAEDREQLERFRREAEVVAALGHPNIVQVTDFQYPEKDGDQPFLVMELLRGESLGSLLAREQVISAQRCAFIAAQVLSALTAAHRAGVVHRDVKPDNVFLLGDAAVPDTVKVLDFGIAKLSVEGQAKLTGTGAMLGTPAFMAPEQARGETDVDGRADVYAVGAMMYQALSGKLPYEAPSIPALLFAIVEKTPPPLRDLRPDLPADLVAVVERAMSKDRNERFPDADAMRRALAPWSGLPASIPPPISATAATVASGNIVYDGATPIVVHRTPAPAKPASASVESPRASGMSALALVAVVLVVGIVATATVFIVLILKKSDERHERAVVAASSMAPAIPSASAPVVAAADSSAPPNPSASTASVVANHAHAMPSTSALPTESASASAPPPVPAVAHKRYGGKTGYMSMGDFEFCHCDYAAFRADLATREAAINACFAASEHEAPIHENPDYEFSVSESGAIGVRKAADGAPNLDRCLTGVVASITMKKTSAGSGSFKMGFRGECTRGWANHCD